MMQVYQYGFQTIKEEVDGVIITKTKNLGIFFTETDSIGISQDVYERMYKENPEWFATAITKDFG